MGSDEDQIRKGRNGDARDVEPCAEVIPQANAEFGGGLGELEEGIARVATEIASGAAHSSGMLKSWCRAKPRRAAV